MRAVVRRSHARLAALVALGTLAGLAVSHVVGRFWWNDVVFALNGWYTPQDVAVYLRAGDAVLAGHSPYPDPATLAGSMNYVYPPPLALLMTPFSALPENRAVPLYMLLSIAAIIVAIRLLGVRDWRCYLLALFFPIVHESLRYGTVSPFLILLLGLLWRYRDTAVVAGSAVALAVLLKLFLWPFVLWLAFTRRFRGAAIAVTVGVAVALASWAVIGFAAFRDYAHLLQLLADHEAESSFSVVAVGSLFGLPYGASVLLALVGGAVLLAAAARVARSPNRTATDRDRTSLTLVLAASLALTPIVWLHFLSLLVVPIAIARPRLSPLWFLPLALWPMFWIDEYRGWPNGDIDAIAAAIGLAIAVCALAARRTAPGAASKRLTHLPLA
jgi:Glycosyltransferase family 87